MKGWLSIIVGLFLALGVAAGAMAHAAERPISPSVVASITGYDGFSTMSDDGQSDPSKASVKFHVCHGHYVGIPVGVAPEPDPFISVKAVPARNGTSLSPQTHSDTFRPPIA